MSKCGTPQSRTEPCRTARSSASRRPDGDRRAGPRGKFGRLVVASPDPALRERLRHVIESRPREWVLSAEHADAASALDDLDTLRPHAVVLDDRVRTTTIPPLPFDAFVGGGSRRSHVLLLGDAGSEPLVAEALQAGIKGIVGPSDDEDLVSAALDAVVRGKPFFSARATEIVLDRFLAMRGVGDAREQRAATRELTRREREVVRLLADGQSTREVANSLSISVKTAENHRANAMNKLGVRRVAELVRRAVQEGVIA